MSSRERHRAPRKLHSLTNYRLSTNARYLTWNSRFYAKWPLTIGAGDAKAAECEYLNYGEALKVQVGKKPSMSETHELTRLSSLGLNTITAIAVMRGELDETFEVARAKEKDQVEIWCRNKKNIPNELSAKWDLSPEHLYLAFDGASPNDYVTADFVLFELYIDEVYAKLAYASSRAKDPWHQSYKSKSCGIAYRWQNCKGVTPPLLSVVKGEANIEQGLHRFHLAKHYGTTVMPFLIRREDLTNVTALFPLGKLLTEFV